MTHDAGAATVQVYMNHLMLGALLPQIPTLLNIQVFFTLLSVPYRMTAL